MACPNGQKRLAFGLQALGAGFLSGLAGRAAGEGKAQEARWFCEMTWVSRWRLSSCGKTGDCRPDAGYPEGAGVKPSVVIIGDTGLFF